MPRWPADRPTPMDLFWSKVDRDGPIPEYRPDLGSCWIWTAGLTHAGYGNARIRRRSFLAHGIAYRACVGPVPEGLELDHLCRVKACVNPTHLEPVTHWENTMRGVGVGPRNAAKTHCPKGHPYSGANLYIIPSTGGRACLTCNGRPLRKLSDPLV